jgi:nucleoside-diphosphate-sugar epimerase
LPKTLIAGCGYIGSALAVRLVAEGHQVWGLKRSWSGDAPAPAPAGVAAIEADLVAGAGLLRLPTNLDFVVYAVSADGRNEAAYRAAYVDGLQRLVEGLHESPDIRRFIFVSSTAVYAQHEGEWVDEESPAEETGFRGACLLRAETLAWRSGLPATVIRLAGIYGPRRIRLIERVLGGEEVSDEAPSRYINLIHRDDCAGALTHVLSLERPERLYLAVDSRPADRREVVRWIAQEAELPDPPVRPRAAGAAAEAGKRCRNSRLLRSGYRLAYPTYREGFAPLIRGEGGVR